MSSTLNLTMPLDTLNAGNHKFDDASLLFVLSTIHTCLTMYNSKIYIHSCP